MNQQTHQHSRPRALQLRRFAHFGLIGACLFAMLAVVPVSAFAQPASDAPGDRSPPPPPPDLDNDLPGPGAGDGERPPRERFNPAEAKARVIETLRRRLNSLTKETTEIQSALAKLESGSTLREVFQEFPIARRMLDQAVRDDVELRRKGGPEGAQRPRRDGTPPPSQRNRAEGPGRHSGPIDPFAEIDPLVRDPQADRLPPLERDLTTEERAEVNEFLAAAMPGVKQQLTQLESKDAPAASARYRQLYPKLERTRTLKQEDPELYTLVLEGLRLRRECLDHARWLAKNDTNGTADASAEVKARKAEFRTQIDRSLTVADGIRQKMIARRLKDRSKLVDEISQFMISRERFGAGDGPPGPGEDSDGPPGRDRHPPRDGPPPRSRP